MPVELRPATALAVLLAVLLVGAGGSLVVTEAASKSTTQPTYLSLEDTDRQLWAYTSTGRSFDRSTLELNAIVYSEPAKIRRQFLERGQADWNVTDPDERDVATDPTAAESTRPAVEWDLTTGSNRYVYLGAGNRTEADGEWLTVDYQIHDGTYLGGRDHIRAYTSPDETAEWTAMQAHREHWDWFMGRHVVTSVRKSQSQLEREFVSGQNAPKIQRIPAEGEQSDIEHWLTIVDLRDQNIGVASLLPMVVVGAIGGGLSKGRSILSDRYPKRDVRMIVLAMGIVAIILSVRLAGIRLERALDFAPKTIAFLLYPALFVGLPAVAYLLARPLDRSRAFAGGSLGFTAAVLLDYTYLGVTHLSLTMFVYRGALAVALGLIAAGSSHTERCDPDQVCHVRLGVLLWVVATLLPLLRHTPLPV